MLWVIKILITYKSFVLLVKQSREIRNQWSNFTHKYQIKFTLDYLLGKAVNESV